MSNKQHHFFKKGIMVKFLTTILLAIIIFAPACVLSSKFFRLSSQAKDNFGIFFDAVESINGEKEGYKENGLMILDKKTAFVYFSSPHLTINVNSIDNDDYTVSVLRPKKCESSQGCFCLFREATVEGEQSDGKVVISPVKSLCKTVNFPVNYADAHCGIGIAKDVNSYQCNGGFMAERELLDPDDFDSRFDTGRRINFVLEKTSAGVDLIDSSQYESFTGGKGGEFGGGGAGGSY